MGADTISLPVFVSGLLKSSALCLWESERTDSISARGSKLHLHTYLHVLLRLHLIFIVLSTEIKVSLLRRFHLWLTTPFLLPASRWRQIHYNFNKSSKIIDHFLNNKHI